jgi:hypothetical protein
MCCGFLALVLLGPRFFGAMWWLFQPARWQAAFTDVIGGGSLWWIWPVVGLIFLPWTTIMFILVAPLGIVGWDWLWLGLAVAADIASYAGGAGRKQIPNYQGY